MRQKLIELKGQTDKSTVIVGGVTTSPSKTERSSRQKISKDTVELDITEAEDTKERWQQYTEELYKKDLNDPDNHDGVITHLEPDLLECEVKWALGSITTNKASRGDGIPAKLFQIL